MHRSRVFAIVNRKGGSGKSTTTRNLASVLSHMGLQVVIGDLDPQASLTRLLVDELDRPGLGTCLLEPAYTARDCLIETPWNIAMLPGDRSIEHAAQMLATRPTGHQRLARVLGALEGFDVVLLDTPPSLGFALTSAVLAAGWAIMPTFTTQEDIDALLDTVGEMDELREGGLPCADLLAVVPNKLHRDSADQKGLALIKQLFGATVSSPIPHLAAIKHASNARLPLDVYDPRSPALAMYRELADKVCGAIDTASPREDLVRADA